LDLLGFPHFIIFKECRKRLKVKEHDTEELNADPPMYPRDLFAKTRGPP